MKTKNVSSKILTIILSTLVVLLTLGAFCLFRSSSASAASPTPTRVLPLSAMESFPLSSPVTTYSDGNTIAVIQADNSLVIYQDGKYKVLTAKEKNFFALKQVNRLSGGALMVSDNGSLYGVDLETYDVARLSFGANSIGGNSFDFNGKYLVTAFGENAYVYEVASGIPTSILAPIEISSDVTVAVNENSVFFVFKNKIYKSNFTSLEKIEEICTASPTKMIANNDNLFYLLDGKIYKVDLATKKVNELSVPSSIYDLGTFETPTDITFSNGNLIVTDKQNDCVQEFCVIDNNLYFTGLAIAKGKTAYNRVVAPKAIEKFDTTIAVLDSHKITLFDTETLDYTERGFKNLRIGNAPDFFAFSGETIFGANSNGSAFIMNVATEEEISVTLGTEIKDVCFRCDYYYALAVNGTSSQVYKLNEQGELLETRTYAQAFNALEVDVFNNFYLANAQYIYRDNGKAFTLFSTSYGATKMASDLSGELYLGNGIYVFNIVFENHSYSPKRFEFGVSKVKDFCIPIDLGSAYFIQSEEEHVYKTDVLENIAVSSIKKPSDYTYNGNSAELDELKVYKAKENANFFWVNVNENGFEYADLDKSYDDFIFIDQIKVNGKLTVNVLKNHNGVAIANADDCEEVTVNYATAPLKASTTTTVHAYYLPLITMNLEHSLIEEENKVLLAMHTEIAPKQIFTVLGTQFYYAEITDGTTTKFGYVPVDFTVEVLAEDKLFDSFVVKQVNTTSVYADKEMTEKLADISGVEVRVYEKIGSVSRIKYLDGDVWKEGYVNTSSIIDPSRNAIRNILIILAVVTSLCGTSSYFILKRSKQ